jgi:DNA-binding HxlR family transcriptional regulator
MNLRSHCPVNFALEHFGDKWSLLIIRDLMFKGKRHYNEFFESEEKVSTSVLGDKLKGLEEAGIITKGEDSVKKSRIRYSLTE